MIEFINRLLAMFTNLALVDIYEIEFICDNCENTDVDCTVTGDPDGVMVVHVMTCQKCETEQ